jgi:hypothetical protein
MNTVDTPIITGKSKNFDDILTEVKNEIETDEFKVILSETDKPKIIRYLKNQKNLKFHKKSSFFLEESVDLVKTKLTIKLKKEYLKYSLPDDNEEENYEYVPYLDDDCPNWLKEIIEKDFSKSQDFVLDYELWVTRNKECLFGPDTKYWIFIAGSDELDNGPEFDEKGEILRGNQENCYDWWEKNISTKFKSKEEMYTELGIMLCSRNFVKELSEEIGGSLFFIPNVESDYITKMMRYNS